MIKPLPIKHTHTEDGVITDRVFVTSVSSADLAEKINEIIAYINDSESRNGVVPNSQTLSS